MKVPVHNFAIVDSNARSRSGPNGLSRALSESDEGSPLPLIPDALVIEMMKAKGSARAWAEVLSSEPEHFAVALPPGKIVRQEIEGDDEPSPVYPEGTLALQDFVKEYKEQGEPALKERMDGSDEAIKDLQADETLINPDFVKEVSQDAIDVIIDSFPADYVEKLEDGIRKEVPEETRNELKKKLIRHGDTLELVAAQMMDSDDEAERIAELMSRPTFTRASALLVLAEVVYALEHGQHHISGLADKTLVNDNIDSQCVLLSALCADLLTQDTRSLELHKLVRAGMNLPAGKLSLSFESQNPEE